MHDYITISNLKIFAHHGVFEEEKTDGQNFYVSAKIGIDSKAPSLTDELDKSVNYATVCELINKFMTDNTFNLIETLANRLAELILNFSDLIKSVELTVNKPEAPVGLPFENIGITVERSRHTAYISYGSNIGDSKNIIDNALIFLDDYDDIFIEKNSSIIVTKPYGKTDQPDFLNGCVKISTFLSPRKLLDRLHEIENAAGRKREEHWGPRTLDLDIIYYDDLVFTEADLCIPHNDMQNREFVLKPLCEIAPDIFHPVLRKTNRQLLEDLIYSGI